MLPVKAGGKHKFSPTLFHFFSFLSCTGSKIEFLIRGTVISPSFWNRWWLPKTKETNSMRNPMMTCILETESPGSESQFRRWMKSHLLLTCRLWSLGKCLMYVRTQVSHLTSFITDQQVHATNPYWLTWARVVRFLKSISQHVRIMEWLPYFWHLWSPCQVTGLQMNRNRLLCLVWFFWQTWQTLPRSSVNRLSVREPRTHGRYKLKIHSKKKHK